MHGIAGMPEMGSLRACKRWGGCRVFGMLNAASQVSGTAAVRCRHRSPSAEKRRGPRADGLRAALCGDAVRSVAALLLGGDHGFYRGADVVRLLAVEMFAQP